ncbi:MAG: DNA repair protein [Alphaproteobacteria bacterium]|jgi:hypothetical protein|nr:DNA repair protein [Alphaproteobacteria bacterium]
MTGLLNHAQRAMHVVSLALLTTIGAAVLAYTIACALGLAPWLSLSLTFGETTIPQAGTYVQIALTGILVSLAFFIPANRRILGLERAHRDFRISMEDVARAYHLCHSADRTGVFTLSSEFDAVRERLSYLRDHPDLDSLEPQVLELAAQMSQQSRELADIYSDEKVARAKTFLRQRQQEAERQQQLIVEALHACRDLRKWTQQIELEESVVASQLAQLEEQLEATLPALGYSLGRDGANVVPLGERPAAE